MTTFSKVRSFANFLKSPTYLPLYPKLHPVHSPSALFGVKNNGSCRLRSALGCTRSRHFGSNAEKNIILAGVTYTIVVANNFLTMFQCIKNIYRSVFESTSTRWVPKHYTWTTVPFGILCVLCVCTVCWWTDWWNRCLCGKNGTCYTIPWWNEAVILKYQHFKAVHCLIVVCN